jgi:hypothetical protein
MWAAGILPFDEGGVVRVPEFCGIVKKSGRMGVLLPILHWFSHIVPRVSDAGCIGQCLFPR